MSTVVYGQFMTLARGVGDFPGNQLRIHVSHSLLRWSSRANKERKRAMKTMRNGKKETTQYSLGNEGRTAKEQPARMSLTRRSFLRQGLAAGAGAATVGLITNKARASH